MRATVLTDNIEGCGLCGEWGLSIYIEYNGVPVLLDAGASGLFARNAQALGVNLSTVKYAVLSHAHYDHSDGMEDFFAANGTAKFYLRSCCGEDCVHRLADGTNKYIGIKKGLLRRYESRIARTQGVTQLMPGAWIVPHSTPGLSAIGLKEQMFRGENADIPDDFAHEQSLVFETEKGLVIFSSCSHGGAVNIINEVRAALPAQPVCAFIGGLHLFNKTEAEVRETGRAIRETGIQYICTGHCTGEAACGILEQELGGMMHRLQVGLVMEF